MDIYNIIYYSLGILVCIGLWFLNAHIIDEKFIESRLKEPYKRFEKCDPILGTGNGIGLVLMNSHARYDDYTDTTVWYLYISLFIPILPIGCYRAKEIGSKGKTTRYKIYGHEKWRFFEILSIYLSAYSFIAGFILILAIICEIFSIV